MKTTLPDVISLEEFEAQEKVRCDLNPSWICAFNFLSHKGFVIFDGSESLHPDAFDKERPISSRKRYDGKQTMEGVLIWPLEDKESFHKFYVRLPMNEKLFLPSRLQEMETCASK